ncbi:MAG: ABC transporter substrate-binding protein [Candidatus Hodarchaeota archaeon]
MQYAQIITEEFSKIGINATLDYLSWSILSSRFYNQEVGPYNEGGYDICLCGMSLGGSTSHPGDALSFVYAADTIPPAGFNAMYWAPDPNKTHGWMDYRAQESDDLIIAINQEINLTRATELIQEWQKVYYDVMPNVMIYSEVEVHVLSTGLYGYDPVAQPFTLENMWMTENYTGTPDTVALASAAAGSGWLPQIISDRYSGDWIPDIHEGLLDLSASVDTVLPAAFDRAAWMEERFGTKEYLARYPQIATSLGTYNANGLNWSIQVRDDVFWHDGHQLDTWDVAFSYQAFLIPDLDTDDYYDLKLAFGSDDDPINTSLFPGVSQTKIHGNYSFIVKDVNNDGFYETIDFIFNTIFIPWMIEFSGYPLLPEHILGDPVTHGWTGFNDTVYRANGWDLSIYSFDPTTNWLVPPKQWSGHSYNTGNPTDPGGYAGPIGTGPYYFELYDQTTGRGTVKKWTDKQWDGSAWVTATGAGSGYRDQDLIEDAPDTGIIIVTSLERGLSDMKAGDINILDPQFTMTSILDELQIHPAIQTTLTAGPVWQVLHFNPKFTAKTPLSETDRCLNRMGVRHAISHIIPREMIIKDTLNGLGIPMFSPILSSSWAAIPSDEFLRWKRDYQGPRDYKLEQDAITSYDDYNISRALEYMAAEGYDMRPWSILYSGTSCCTDEFFPDSTTSLPPTSHITSTETHHSGFIDLLPILQILEIGTILCFIMTLVIIIRRHQLR